MSVMASQSGSRGIIGLTCSIAGGAISAALLSAAFLHPQTMLVFLACLAGIPLLMAGLGTGVFGALVAGGAGLTSLSFAAGPLNFADVYVTVYAVPAVLLTMIVFPPTGNMKKNKTPVEGSLMTAVTLYPCLIFLTVFSAILYGGGDALTLTVQTLHGAFEPVRKDVDPETFAKFSSFLDQLAPLLPAILGSTWMFSMMGSVIIAQMALQQQGWSLRPNFSLQALHIPNWLIIAAAATGIAGLAAPAPYGYLGSNLCFFLCVPFFFVGLAVVHAWADTTKVRGLVLVVFYIAVSLLVWVILLVTFIGVLDQWLNFRQKLAGMKKGGK